MGNLCSIFHSRFKNLIKVIPSTRKAQLLDYILLGWQTSIYTLKGSDKKWFMKPYSQIVEDTGIPKSTLERYIKELADAGFIERRQALYSRTVGQGTFEVKKGTYIYITEQLLALLNPAQLSSLSASMKQDPDSHNNPKGTNQKNPENPSSQQPECLNLNKNEGIDPLKMRESYIRDLYTSVNNNITHKKIQIPVDNLELPALTHQYQKVHDFIYTGIQEEIPDEVKKLIAGTLFNLTFTHKKIWSHPAQVAAEYLFALINTEFYMPTVTSFTHRNNILASLLRQNRWRTPKGFFNHFYLGEQFRDHQQLREQRWQKQKEDELGHTWNSVQEYPDEQLQRLEAQMMEKSALIEELTQSIYLLAREDEISTIQEQILNLRKELEALWMQQAQREQDIAQRQQHLAFERCCA